MPIETQNSFSPLADLVDEPEDSFIVGETMIRHQLEEFCGRAPKRRKRYCYPGAKIDDITKALEQWFSNFLVSLPLGNAMIGHHYPLSHSPSAM